MSNLTKDYIPKIGDIIEILHLPYQWCSSVNGNYYEFPLDLLYPITIKIKDFESKKYPTENDYSITDGTYSWSLNSIIDAGANLIQKSNASRFPFDLQINDAKRIINIACITWKKKLLELWSIDLVEKSFVQISEVFYKQMRKECTPGQHILFDSIFGKDVIVPNYKDGDLLFVRRSDLHNWQVKHFAEVKDNNVYCYNYNYDTEKDRIDPTSWKYHAPCTCPLPE